MIRLRAIANRYTSLVHPNETITLYRSLGQEQVPGKKRPIYAAPVTIPDAQIQQLTADDLVHQGMTSQTEIDRRCYLPSDNSTTGKPAGIIRPFERNGDMIQREDGTWWLVTAPLEDFTKSEWVAVRITLQTKAPDFSASEWWEGA